MIEKSEKRGFILTVLVVSLVGILLILSPGVSAHPLDDDYNGSSEMNTSENAIVMNANSKTLPQGCDSIRGEKKITVKAGKEYARVFPGEMFTYNNRTYYAEPCTKLTVEFVNKDHVRHQWMVHGLPKEIYPMGMFNIEVTGPGKKTGTFITPSKEDTLLVHCGVPQHAQKGMRAQIKIGKSKEDLENIPGISSEKQTGEDGLGGQSPIPDSVVLALGFGIVGGAMIAGYWEMRKR